MILRYSNDRNNTKTILTFRCDKCLVEYDRVNRNYQKMKNNSLYDRDYCRKCWTGILNSRDEYRQSMSQAIQKMYIEHPEIRDKISKTSRERKVNHGNKNGMKQLQARKKVSEAQKLRFSDPAIRKHISKKVKEAWARGDFDGVRVGQCKWHDYLHSDGEIYKVQGTWELAFIEWVDKNNLDFKCHRGRIPYVLNGVDKNFYPDFWINKWNSYVDVKCPYFYVKEKFDAIRESNPDIEVKVLFKDDLVKLGVNL